MSSPFNADPPRVLRARSVRVSGSESVLGLESECLACWGHALGGSGSGTLVPLAASGVDDSVWLLDITLSDGTRTAAEPVPLVAGAVVAGRLPYPLSDATASRVSFSDRDWTSAPHDPRPNLWFEGRLQPPRLTQALPLAPGGDRRSALGALTLTLDNHDGAFDLWPSLYSINGRRIVLSRLPSRASTTDQAQVVFVGVGATLRADGTALTILATDLSASLRVPLLALYGGTGGADSTGGPEGPGAAAWSAEDGTLDNLGKPIQQVYGEAHGVSPVLVDGVNGLYQLSDRVIDSLLAVYGRGAPAVLGTAYGSFGELQAASTPAGAVDYAITSGGTWLKPGSAPDGAFTLDVRGDAHGGYVATTAGVTLRILERVIEPDLIDLASFTAHAARDPGVVGVVVKDQATAYEVVSGVVGPSCGWWGDSGDGLIRIGQVLPPDPAEGGWLIDAAAIAGEIGLARLPDTVDPCLWRVLVGYERNWTPQGASSLVDPSVIGAQRHYQLQQAARATFVTKPERRVRDPLARDFPDNSKAASNTPFEALSQWVTLYRDAADAKALGAYLLTLFAPGLCLWTVPVGPAGFQVRLGDNARVVWPALGFAAGRWVRVVGRESDGLAVTLTVMGYE